MPRLRGGLLFARNPADGPLLSASVPDRAIPDSPGCRSGAAPGSKRSGAGRGRERGQGGLGVRLVTFGGLPCRIARRCAVFRRCGEANVDVVRLAIQERRRYQRQRLR
jgi:hypothetical protein